MNTKNGESRNLTGSIGTNWGPAWSPDDRYIAFKSDRAGTATLWVCDMQTTTLHQISEAQVIETFGGVQWTPDSKHLVVTVLPEGMGLDKWFDALDSAYKATLDTDSVGPNIKERGSSVRLIDVTATSPFNKFFSDLAIIDIGDGGIERISSGVRPLWWQVSPTGSYVALMSYSGEARAGSAQGLYDLLAISLSTGKTNTLARQIQWQFGTPISWSPNGELLTFAAGGPESSTSIFLASTTVRHTTLITRAPTQDFDQPSSLLWDAAGKSIYIATPHALWQMGVPDGRLKQIVRMADRNITLLLAQAGNRELLSDDHARSAVVLTTDSNTLQEGFYRVDLLTGSSTRILEESKSYTIFSVAGNNGLYVSAYGQTVVYLAEDAQHPQDIWVTDANMYTPPHQVTHTNPQFDRLEMGRTRLIAWRSTDGLDLRGVVLLPPEYKEGQRYPFITCVYGGARGSNTFNEWDPVAAPIPRQFLASRGYVVFLPDAPQRVGTPMEDLAKTVIPGVEKAIDMGIADPRRLGVMGISYGGYSTLALIVQSRLFAAAVSVAGVVNLMDSYVRPGTVGVSIAWAENGQGKIGGSLWQFRDRFVENSPLFYLDRVETPLLLIHGTEDTSPVMESRLAYGALKRLGKNVVLAEYPGEEHAPDQWSAGNQADYFARVVSWLDRQLEVDAKRGSVSKLN